MAMYQIYEKAAAAGKAAAEAIVPRAMVVSGMGQQYYVSEGVCGFAWVNVRPGNSKFAKWLVQSGLARKNSYEGGVQIWVSEYGQSMQRKEAFAHAFAEVLRAEGIKAYAGSRMD